MKVLSTTGPSLPCLIVGLLCLAGGSIRAASTNVNIVDFAFNPSAVSIQPNDSVTWSWVGTFSHSSTSNDTNLWNSGIQGTGATFSHTFTSAGTFPYHCMVHPFMTAAVTVQSQTATNVPPTVSITSPADGSTFPAPWSGTIQANAADSDGTVTKVSFFAGTNLLEPFPTRPVRPALP